MALKPVVSKLDEVAEPLREHYTEKEGKFYLSFDGAIPGVAPLSELEATKTKLGEFRDNNVALIKERDTLKTQLGTVDPEEYKTLKAEKEKLTQKGVKGADDIEIIVKRHVEAATTPLAAKVTTLEQTNSHLSNRLQQMTVDDQITQLAVKAGAQPTAIRDVLNRARETWKFVDGKAVAMDGEKPVYSPTKVTEPLGMEEWVSSLAISDAHLFKPSSGGGAANPGGGTGATGATRTITNPDAVTFGKNLEDIAKGKAEVVLTGHQQ